MEVDADWLVRDHVRPPPLPRVDPPPASEEAPEVARAQAKEMHQRKATRRAQTRFAWAFGVLGLALCAIGIETTLWFATGAAPFAGEPTESCGSTPAATVTLPR